VSPDDDPAAPVHHDRDTSADTSDASGPGVAALRALVANGTWQRVPGLPAALLYIRSHSDGSADSLTVYDDHDARAARTNPDGATVWRLNDSLAGAVAALRRLPSPLDPDAPRDVLDGGSAAHIWGM
jgi:hypothetical protein